MTHKPMNTSAGRKVGNSGVSRRTVLRGLGGATLALPFLEAFSPRSASALAADVQPFAIFFRQANGVACANTNEELGVEPERFWPKELGALTATNVQGRALDELTDYLSRMLVVGDVSMQDFEYGDGHARGALQGLTAAGPVEPRLGGDSEAAGESIDHRIGRELNPDGRDSLVLYAGQEGGWLGGPCISWRAFNNRRSALNDPWNAYQTMIGGAGGLSPEAIERLARRRESVNDLVRDQLKGLLKVPQLSKNDRERLDLHLTSLRDLESSLTCRMSESDEMVLSGMTDVLNSTDGTQVLQTARYHMDIAAISVACGYTRSVSIQVGNGNDSATQYRDPETGSLMENYHYISHRRLSHDASGTVISNGNELHHKIDRQFAQAFKHLLDRLDAYDLGGSTLLDRGVAVWYNDLGNGPGHGPKSIPWVMAGGCAGYFKQGQYIKVDPGRDYWELVNHARVLNAIGTAVGCRTDGKEQLEDFGYSGDTRTPHPELRA